MFTTSVGYIGQSSTAEQLGPEQRRQGLRWLMRDGSTSYPAIDEVLRACLRDADAEVRMTAVLAAARLRAREVLPTLHAASLPSAIRELEDPRERRTLEQLWKGVIRYLLERQLPSVLVPGKDPLKQLRALVDGEPLEVTDATSLLLHSLTTTLELGRRPHDLPSGVIEQNGQFRLRRSGLPLQWVAPIDHWLGADSPRRVRSEGFFVARFPMDNSMAAWMGNPLPIRVVPDRDQTWLGTFDEARRFCETLSRIEKISLRPPTADEWEMAARGPDGRRHPWGNLPRWDGERCASPWGVEDLVGNVPEWSFDPENATRLLRGGVESRTWMAHGVELTEEEPVAALRPIIPALPL